MKHKIKSLLNSKGLQQSFLMIFGNSIATGISALSLIIISRMLGPSNFGEFSFGFAFILILVRINDAGLSSALMKYVGQTTDNQKRNIYFSNASKFKIKISIVLILLGLISYKYLNRIFKLENPEIIILSFVFGMSSVYLEQLTVMLQGLHEFNKAVLSNFLQALTKIITTLFFLYIQVKNVLIVFGTYAIAPIVPLLFYKRLLPSNIQIFTKLKSPKEKKELFSMAKHTGIANLSTTLVSQVSIIFAQAYLTSYETGILGGVSKIQMLFSLIAISLGNVLFPRVSRYKKKKDLFIYITKAFSFLLISLFGLVFSVLLAKTMIIVTIGADYLPGLNTLYVLLVAVFIMIATIPFTALFYSYNKNIFFSISGFLQVIFILAGNIILIPKFGLLGTAYTQLITAIILFFITLYWGLSIYFKQKD